MGEKRGLRTIERGLSWLWGLGQPGPGVWARLAQKSGPGWPRSLGQAAPGVWARLPLIRR
jgi:hypothetical protein